MCLLCVKKQEAKRIQQVAEHRSQRGFGPQDRVARREEFRAMRDNQMLEHQAELEKIIGKEKVQKWNELRQDVRDYNRAGRMCGRGYYNNNRRYYDNRRYNNSNRRNFNNRRYDNSNQPYFDNRRYDNNRLSDNMMRMSPKERAALMTDELDLTKEQTGKILALSEKHEAERIEQIRAHRNNRGTGTQNRDAQRIEFRDLRNKQMKEQQAELEKWNELRQDVRDYNRDGRRNSY